MNSTRDPRELPNQFCHMKTQQKVAIYEQVGSQQISNLPVSCPGLFSLQNCEK